MTDTIELELTGIAHGGEALGHLAGAGPGPAKVVFVPYAIPGERVRAELVEVKERWARARLIEVLRADPDRVEPPCPYFGPGLCGGCHWQHIAYPRQAELKQEIVRDQLVRLAHLPDPPVADILVLADPAAPGETPEILTYNYRNRMRFGVTADGHLGLRRASGQDILAVDECLLLHEQLDALHASLDLAWPALAGLTLRAGVNTGQAMIVLHAGAGDEPELELDVPAACVLQSARGLKPLIGDPWIEEAIADRRYRISAESVFPVNTAGAEARAEIVAAYLAPRPDDVVLDLYSGVGLLALTLADSAAQVIGVEASPAACEDFAANAAARTSITLHEGPVEQVLPAISSEAERLDLAVLTPPRTGAGPEVIRLLAGFAPRRIVHVSLDPAMLARDALHLVAAGYRLLEVQPLDSQPQTAHVETIACWEKTAL